MKLDDLYGSRIDLVDLITVGEKGLEDMYEYSSNPDFYRYMEYEHHRSVNETREYLLKLIERSGSENAHYWFVTLKESGKVVGSVGLLNIDRRKGSAEIGYGISPGYWGKGIFSEALRLVLDHCFKKMGFHRVSAVTPSDNRASIKALEKAGFKNEGVMRDYYLSFKDARRYDAVMMGILNKEYAG